MNNIKNTWKGTKSVINIKNTSPDFPKCLFSNGSTFTNQIEISSIFGNYFASIAQKTKVSIIHTNIFSNFLKDKNQNSFFLCPTNRYEIQNISSLNSNKSVGPNNIL